MCIRTRAHTFAREDAYAVEVPWVWRKRGHPSCPLPRIYTCTLAFLHVRMHMVWKSNKYGARGGAPTLSSCEKEPEIHGTRVCSTWAPVRPMITPTCARRPAQATLPHMSL